MKNWWLGSWITLRASYWFVPSLMAIGAIALSVTLVSIDAALPRAWMEPFGWLYPNRPDGARSLLSTVAGSMITVAGVTFSMTLLAVSHASSQIGPRLMANYMEDRGNQFTLGTFIATFLYCLMILRTVSAGGDGEGATDFVPQLSVMFGVVLAIVSVMVLIYFIHHVPQSISVPRVIVRVGDEIEREIESQFSISESHSSRGMDQHSDAQLAEDCQLIGLNNSTGYLRLIDRATLLETTVSHDVRVEVLCKPGDYSVIGEPLLKVWSGSELDKALSGELQEAFAWGAERTRDQDIRYPIEQMLEILAKAMSPGVNGQYTALLCLDQLGRALRSVFLGQQPLAWLRDESGLRRVHIEPVSRQDVAQGIFLPVRQFVADDGITSRHWLSTLRRILDQKPAEPWRQMLTDEVTIFAKA